MQYSTLLLTIFPLLALAAPAPSASKRQIQEDIMTAALNWQQDTGFVSSYLDYAVSTLPNSPPNLQTNGAQALAAEMNELSHKMVLDNFFITGTDTPNQDVINASNTLTGGPFTTVVNLLGDISRTGNLDDIANINSGRCATVLPAIDVYFAAVAQALGTTGQLVAIRPLACGGI
ncbi:hypothetical protein EG329_006043 [Mollisiaceae sp. DMI_Dod_QoI]|nr:hypothetical protein EG329_006043 [Helotiales sp. DMI_Dod_QoI]